MCCSQQQSFTMLLFLVGPCVSVCADNVTGPVKMTLIAGRQVDASLLDGKIFTMQSPYVNRDGVTMCYCYKVEVGSRIDRSDFYSTHENCLNLYCDEVSYFFLAYYAYTDANGTQHYKTGQWEITLRVQESDTVTSAQFTVEQLFEGHQCCFFKMVLTIPAPPTTATNTTSKLNTTCEAQRKLGPDIRVWDFLKWPITIFSMVVGDTIYFVFYWIINMCILVLTGFMGSLPWFPDLPFHLGAQGDLMYGSQTLHGLSGVVETISILVGMFFAAIACCFVTALCMMCCSGHDAERACEQLTSCKDDCLCNIIGNVLYYVGGFLCACYLVVYSFVFPITFILYPLFAYKHWFRLDRAILVCMPFPHIQPVAICEYTILPYTCFWLFNIQTLAKCGSQFRHSCHDSWNFGITYGTYWQLMMSQDAVTDSWTLVKNVLRMPWWWSLLWAVCTLLAWILAYTQLAGLWTPSGHWWLGHSRVKACESIFQFILALANAGICIQYGFEFDQYTLYSGMNSFLSTLAALMDHFCRPEENLKEALLD